MTLDWPLVTLAVAALVVAVVALRSVLPYVVGQSSEATRQKALDELNKRMAAVEAHLGEQRRMPGRLR